jgi:CBS-domain-containing membrane protein
MALLVFLSAVAGSSVILTSWASAIGLIVFDPSAPGVAPRTMIVAHTSAAVVGVAFAQLSGHAHWAIGPSVGMALLLGLRLKCLHAPAIANAVIPIVTPTPPFAFLAAAVGGCLVLTQLPGIVRSIRALRTSVEKARAVLDSAV